MSDSGLWHFILWIHYLAIALWTGGILVLAGVAIPAIHASIPSRAIAGDIVEKILKRLNFIEIVCCLMLIITSFTAFRFIHTNEQWLAYLILVIVVMGFFTFYYSFNLMPRLESIKERLPTLDNNSNHAAKSEFDRLHALYIKLMSLNLALGLIVLYGSVLLLK